MNVIHCFSVKIHLPLGVPPGTAANWLTDIVVSALLLPSHRAEDERDEGMCRLFSFLLRYFLLATKRMCFKKNFYEHLKIKYRSIHSCLKTFITVASPMKQFWKVKKICSFLALEHLCPSPDSTICGILLFLHFAIACVLPMFSLKQQFCCPCIATNTWLLPCTIMNVYLLTV